MPRRVAQYAAMDRRAGRRGRGAEAQRRGGQYAVYNSAIIHQTVTKFGSGNTIIEYNSNMPYDSAVEPYNTVI